MSSSFAGATCPSRGILRFDMRDPARFVLRLPHEGQVAPAKLDDMRAAVDAVAASQSSEG